MLQLWHIWVIAALVFIIIEIFSSGFAVICFSVGALLAALLAGLDAGLVWQIGAFAAASGVCLFTLRPALLKLFARKGEEVRTNVDAVIGRVGRVTEAVDPAKGTGRIAIDGDDWKAECDTPLGKGERAEVVERNGLTLKIKQIQ